MKNKIYSLTMLLIFATVGIGFVSCGSDDEDNVDPNVERIKLYKQKIIGEWELVGEAIGYGTNFSEPPTVLKPIFYADGKLVYANNPTARHEYNINDKGLLELNHIDSTKEYFKKETLNLRWQDDYNTMLIGPDKFDKTEKYRRIK
jgi:hypothetical protein